MKKSLGIIAILAAIPFLAIGQNSAINFESDSWERILEKAKTSGKIIFLDAYATWCGPCKTMEKETFTDEQVGDYFNENFINARIDMENDPDGPFLSMNYDVQAYPSLFFINPDGELAYKREGLLYPEEFLAMGTLVKDEMPKVNLMRERYKNGDRDSDFILSYIEAIEKFQLDDQDVVINYIQSLSNNELQEPKNIKLIYKYIDDYKSREFQSMLKNSEISESQIGIKEFNEFVYLIFLERIYTHLVEDDMAGIENTKIEAKRLGIENLDEALSYGYAYFYLQTQDFEKAMSYASQLAKDPGILEVDLFNNIAWGIYETADEKNVDLLMKAKDLTRRSLLESDMSDNNDTYASILYKLGEFDLAIEYMKRAVKLAEEEGSVNFSDFSEKLLEWQENN